MLFSILSLVAGIIVVQQLPVLPENYWIVVLLILATCFTLFRLWRLMFFTIGLLWAIGFASIRLADRLPVDMEGQHLLIEGQVTGLPQYDDRRVRFDFLVSKSLSQVPGKIRLSWYFPKQQIKAGQNWQMTVKLKKPHGRINPGGFDYERWLFTENIGATGYVRTNPPPVLQRTKVTGQDFTVIRQTISDQLTLLLEHSDNIGIIKALTIGDRHEITDKQWDVFRRTGTVHLVAISGLHIGLISGLVYFLMLKIAVKTSINSPQKIAAVSAVIVAVFYSALAGFSLPTQRSLIMLIIAMSAMVLQRNISTINILALAMLGVLIFDPFAVLSVGFWLSFLAVAVIVYSLGGRLGKPPYWLSATKIHCVTAIGLSPLLLFYFQNLSIIAPAANFIAVPIVSLLLVPLCFIAVLSLSISPDFAMLVYQLIDKILQSLWYVLSVMAETPYSVITTTSNAFYLVPLALLGVFILLSPIGIPARWLGGVMLLPLLFTQQDKPAVGEATMALLDVGQGLAIVIQTTNHTLVFDTGAKYSEHYNMGSSVVIPYLQYKGLQSIDTLIVSHGDNDHIGGVKSVVEQSKVQTVLTSVPKLLMQYQPVQCKRGQRWDWDQVVFEIISPALGEMKGENNNSCVLKVTAKHGSVLLTGDIEKEAELGLLEHERLKLKSDVLIAAHHGSKTSSTMSFLIQADPDMILIPAGYKNRYSFPHDEVINRYNKLNKKWMNTAVDGAIIVNLNNNGVIEVDSMRIKNKRYWN